MNQNDKHTRPIHPGEILRNEFMEPMGITQYRLTTDLSVQPLIISEIVNLQSHGGHAKPYQVKQVRRLILRYKLGAGE